MNCIEDCCYLLFNHNKMNIYLYKCGYHYIIVWYISAYLHSRVIPVKEHVYYCLHTYVIDTGLLRGSSNAVAADVQ